MAYQHQVNYQPYPVRKLNAFAALKQFILPLCIVAFIEMVATVITIVLYFLGFGAHYLLIEVPVIILAAFGMSFLIVRKTGRIGSGLLANLLLNFGYHIGAVIGLVFLFLQYITVYDSFEAFSGTTLLAFVSFCMMWLLIGINLLCCLPGVWLGNRLYQRTLKDGPGRNDRERNKPGDGKQHVLGDVEA